MSGDTANFTLNTLTFDELKFDITEEDFRNLHLRYRGEGNDNLVLQVPNVSLSCCMQYPMTIINVFA